MLPVRRASAQAWAGGVFSTTQDHDRAWGTRRSSLLKLARDFWFPPGTSVADVDHAAGAPWSRYCSSQWM